MSPSLAHVASGPFGFVELLPLLLAVAAYARRASTLAARGQPVPAGRCVAFYSGIGLVVVALLPPVGVLAEDLVLGHMVQHVLMMDLAAPLIVIGLTGPLMAPLLRIRAVDRLRALAHPAVALPVWAAGLVFWHLPFAYQGAFNDGFVHLLQHSCFLGFAVLLWMPLLGPLPRPAWFGYGLQLGYVVAARLVSTALANVLMWSGTVFYPDYAPGQAQRGIDPLTDQSIGGVIMATEGFVVTFLLFGWVFLRAAREGEESQRLVDEAEAMGVALDPRRAARAVAAGRGEELRERLLGATDRELSGPGPA